jgi:hypothetical protein
LVRTSRTLLRITRVVFRHQFDRDLLAADGHTLGVEFVDGHAAPFSLSLPRWAIAPLVGPT